MTLPTWWARSSAPEFGAPSSPRPRPSVAVPALVVVRTGAGGYRIGVIRPAPAPPADSGSGSGRVRSLLRRVGWLALVLVLAAVSSPAGAQEGGPPRVLATTVAGPITPVIAEHIADGISEAAADGYDAYLVELDTPGGLDTSMRAIVQEVLASPVPVIVHIGPRGARGASAGAIIVLSAHVASMAPGTSIGAATPVGGGGGEDLDAKVVNEAAAYSASLAELRGRDVDFATAAVTEGRSIGAVEAARLGVVDVVASDRAELFEAVDGTVVPIGGEDITLAIDGAEVTEQDMGFLRTVQQFLADPNIAFLLMSIGTLALVYEFASPGLGAGGVLGTTFIILGLFGLAVLPVTVVGVAFLVLAAVFFVAELFAPGIGIAAAGGALCLVLGGIFLIDDAPGLEVSLVVVLPVALVVAGFVVVAGRYVVPLRRAPSTTTGAGAMVGERAVVHRSTTGAPQAFVGGAWWAVRSGDGTTLPADGTEVVVTGLDDLHLVVDEVAEPGDAQRGRDDTGGVGEGRPP
jgi:membrane-bound serine protease (ClpP class)